MKGKLEDNDTFFTPFNDEADTVGISLAAAYTMNMSNTNGLTFKAGYQVYGFSNWTGPNSPLPDFVNRRPG